MHSGYWETTVAQNQSEKTYGFTKNSNSFVMFLKSSYVDGLNRIAIEFTALQDLMYVCTSVCHPI